MYEIAGHEQEQANDFGEALLNNDNITLYILNVDLVTFTEEILNKKLQ